MHAGPCHVDDVTGAPAAEASAPGEQEEDGELQAEAMSVPLRGQGGAVTPLTDVRLLFAQNQSKLKALKVRSECWPLYLLHSIPSISQPLFCLPLMQICLSLDHAQPCMINILDANAMITLTLSNPRTCSVAWSYTKMNACFY